MTSIVTMNIKVGDVEEVMNICIPYAVVEPVIDKINTKYWYSTAEIKDDDKYRELIEDNIHKAKIPVRAIMGRSAISVNDFIHLQPGDIIKLNTKIEDEMDVYVGNIKKFSAAAGVGSFATTSEVFSAESPIPPNNALISSCDNIPSMHSYSSL